MYITNKAQQQLTESTQQACISKQLHRTKSMSLVQLIMARWPVTEAREEKVEEEEENHTYQTPGCIPGRHGKAVPARPTRRGRGKSSPAAPSQHREHPSGTLPPVPLSHPNTTQQTPGEDPARCQARRRQGPAKPERDPALDLLGEVESSKSFWWGRKRTQRRAFGPRWRQRRTSEVAGIAGRRRGNLGSPKRELGRERGSERGRVGWVGLTDPDPSRLGQPARWAGLGNGLKPICKFEFK
jgi:hypothetical protein